MKSFAEEYLKILKGPLEGLNLTRIITPEDFYIKQILDSLEPLKHSSQFLKALESDLPLIDVGFGGGFPLLPLAKLYPHKRFIGFEARKKKVEAVKLIASTLNITNVTTYHQRVEDVLFDIPTILTFKAVSDISDLLTMIHGSANQEAYFYKGPKCDEKEKIDQIFHGWSKISDAEYELDKTNGRRILGFKGVTVLRGTKYNKPLVKLSKLI